MLPALLNYVSSTKHRCRKMPSFLCSPQPGREGAAPFVHDPDPRIYRPTVPALGAGGRLSNVEVPATPSNRMLVPREAEFDGGGDRGAGSKRKNKLAVMREEASRHSHLQMLANVDICRRSGMNMFARCVFVGYRLNSWARFNNISMCAIGSYIFLLGLLCCSSKHRTGNSNRGQKHSALPAVGFPDDSTGVLESRRGTNERASTRRKSSYLPPPFLQRRITPPMCLSTGESKRYRMSVFSVGTVLIDASVPFSPKRQGFRGQKKQNHMIINTPNNNCTSATPAPTPTP